MLHSMQGQDIEGSCCNGNSRWPEFCVGEYSHNRKLHFATYYRIVFENFFLFSNGSFSRETLEDSPVPVPAESNFCSGGAGKVKESLKGSTYTGTWTIKALPNTPNLNYHSSHSLELLATGGTGTGFGNPGGAILHTTCDHLTLVQLDRGSGNKHLFKIYYPANSSWWNMN